MKLTDSVTKICAEAKPYKPTIKTKARATALLKALKTDYGLTGIETEHTWTQSFYRSKTGYSTLRTGLDPDNRLRIDTNRGQMYLFVRRVGSDGFVASEQRLE